MCRCCQNCWEDFYWNCIEERFCYDESIANYNPDEDEDYVTSQKNGGILSHMQATDNNNLTVPPPICNQPIRRGNSTLFSNGKIHEEDYRRETQNNVPMLGPEILAVFANSQIFQDHQPTKINRISTRPNLAGIHTPSANKENHFAQRETEQERLLRRLEANLNGDSLDASKLLKVNGVTPKATTQADGGVPEKRITFTLSTDSSPEGSQVLTPTKFESIAEEDSTDANSTQTPTNKEVEEENDEQPQKEKKEEKQKDDEEVILRPRLFDRHPHLQHIQAGSGFGIIGSGGGGMASPQKRTLRSVKSVPHFNVRSAASETDIFAITGSGGQISMTPEVPSISFSNLPKNYEDTPTIEKYRVSQSLYSIQAANAARASQDDYSMPRYFRRPPLLSAKSSEMLSPSISSSAASGLGASTSLASISQTSSSSNDNLPRRSEEKKSKRLQMLRGNLPPLLIHSVSFRKNRDEAKQVD